MLEISVVPDLVGATPPPTLPADATVRAAAHALLVSGQGALALLDDQGNFHALVTADAFVEFVTTGEDADTTPASELAVATADHLSPDDSALDALMLMTRRGASHLPVLDDARRLVGIVSQARILVLAETAMQTAYRHVEDAVFGPRLGDAG